MTPRRKRGNSEGSNPRRRADGRFQINLRVTDEDGNNPDAKIDQERVDAALAAINRVSDFCHDEWARLRDVKLKMLGEDEDPERG